MKSEIPSVGLRLGSMLLDHFIMCFLLIPPFILILFVTGTNVPFEMPVYPFYAIILIYLNKDGILGQSIAKRLVGLQVIDRKTGLPANELKCFLRNMTIPVWPIEAIAVLISPSRRIGDLIANTRTVVEDKKPPLTILSDLKGRRPNANTWLTLIACVAYAALLWLAMDSLGMNSSSPRFQPPVQ